MKVTQTGATDVAPVRVTKKGNENECRLCLALNYKMGTQFPPPQKGGRPPIFGPGLLWPKGWMDQYATWYEGRPWPSHIVLHGDSAPPNGAQPPNFRPMSIVAKWSLMSATAEHLFIYVSLFYFNVLCRSAAL